MNPIPKTKRIKLSPDKYKKLAYEVADRDGDMCLCCGRFADDRPHHIIYKSEQGSDIAENLASICMECHNNIHHRDMYEAVMKMCHCYGPKKVIQDVLLRSAGGKL